MSLIKRKKLKIKTWLKISKILINIDQWKWSPAPTQKNGAQSEKPYD
jgi:hypothetical protein